LSNLLIKKSNRSSKLRAMIMFKAVFVSVTQPSTAIIRHAKCERSCVIKKYLIVIVVDTAFYVFL